MATVFLLVFPVAALIGGVAGDHDECRVDFPRHPCYGDKEAWCECVETNAKTVLATTTGDPNWTFEGLLTTLQSLTSADCSMTTDPPIQICPDVLRSCLRKASLEILCEVAGEDLSVTIPDTLAEFDTALADNPALTAELCLLLRGFNTFFENLIPPPPPPPP